ncbi:MAG: cytochrome c oxidase assembly protein [Propionibacteriaceae bacterium]
MEQHLHEHGDGWLELAVGGVLPGVVVLLAALYVFGFVRCRRRGRDWSRTRLLLWLSGSLVCLAALVGPLAELGHRSFAAHMVGHLLLGMLGPLLLVRAAPVTLLLRVLPTTPARKVVRVLGSGPVRVVSHPLVSGAGNLGGVWLLYTTGLFGLSQSLPWLHALVHLHVLTFGYLFTAAVVGVDPDRHRSSFPVRSLLLVLFAAGHAILAKSIYARPPAGVPTEQAESGAMVMYYGGDVVEVLVLVLLWAAWYAATAPRTARPGRLEAV